MIITVSELQNYITTNASYDYLELLINSIETFIKKYTNNDFIDRQTGEVVYPPDVKLGAINLCRWEVTNRDKVGIQSESISRHSVSYFNMDGENADFGYPSSLLGFLKPYLRARF